MQDMAPRAASGIRRNASSLISSKRLARHADIAVARASRRAARMLVRERQLRRARAFVHARYFEPVTLTQVASIACMSVSHFSRVYASFFGVTVSRELLTLRLSLADYLLKETALSVSQIATSVGLECRTTLFRQFKREFGKSPKEVRRDQRRLRRLARVASRQRAVALTAQQPQSPPPSP